MRDKVKEHIDMQNVNGNIYYKWIDNDGNRMEFSTSQVWKVFRRNNPKVNWWHVIWFKQFDPKQAFIIWLAKLNRLNTQDRIQKWMPNQSFKCVLCDKVNDSVNHLFFSCEYSLKVWSSLKHYLLFKGLSNCLIEIIQSLAQYPYTSNIWCILNRIVLAACVYYIWQERNYRIFKKAQRSEGILSDEIVKFVQIKMLTFRVKQSKAVKCAAKIWKLKLQNSRFCIE
ncbi:uncharacterized protein [Rutidosis leptorrhynchoides]|uniref:uncharacterized protein n=1 Tax=Rutidosis leptorrhynchoides TaxID=125765 RepID=UPI003A990A52